MALGHGPDPGGDEPAPPHSEVRPAIQGEGGGVLPPDSEHFLPADDRRERADAARDGGALLHGLVPDADHRPASDHRVVLVHFAVLRGGTYSPASRKLISAGPVP